VIGPPAIAITVAVKIRRKRPLKPPTFNPGSSISDVNIQSNIYDSGSIVTLWLRI
jgi:hypothetical protein